MYGRGDNAVSTRWRGTQTGDNFRFGRDWRKCLFRRIMYEEVIMSTMGNRIAFDRDTDILRRKLWVASRFYRVRKTSGQTSAMYFFELYR
jgi:hypothetical protein